jgi:hypothetical protein
MWKADKDGYKTWLTAKITDTAHVARSHGFRFRGQYEKELVADRDIGGIEITDGIPGENVKGKGPKTEPASTIVTGVPEAPGA